MPGVPKREIKVLPKMKNPSGSMGGDQENKKRTAEVAAIISRQKVKDTRNRKKARKREAFAKDLIDNPGTWPCGHCVDDHRDDPTTPDIQIHKTWNSFSARMCRKCQKPKAVETHRTSDLAFRALSRTQARSLRIK